MNNPLKNMRSLGIMLFFCCLAIMPSFGQGFRVTPMKYILDARPGQQLTEKLEIRNSMNDARQDLELFLVDVDQDEKGLWRVLGKPDETTTHSELSASRWVSINPEKMTIDPSNAWNVEISIRVPQGVRGSYYTGLIVQPIIDSNATGLQVYVRYMIPIIINVQGNSLRRDIQLKDIDMVYDELTGGTTSTTKVAMRIVNFGRIYGRIQGNVDIMRSVQGQFRKILATNFAEQGILPGADITLSSDLGRRLPSGNYKLRGQLLVDGKRIRPLETDIAFQGDASTETLAADVTLVLNPNQVTLKSKPGVSQTAMLNVENPSDQPIQVKTGLAVSEKLKGTTYQNRTGDQYSCVEWARAYPETFTIQPGRRQNVRVTAQMPKDKEAQANYYGQLVFNVFDSQKQSLGQVTADLHVNNPAIKDQAGAVLQNIQSVENEEGQCLVTAKILNSGNTRCQLEGVAELKNVNGVTVTSATLAAEGAPLLPLETRILAGPLNLEGVAPGNYEMLVDISGTGDVKIQERPAVQVTEKDGQKQVEVIGDVTKE